MTTVLIPVKSLALAKSRLAEELSPLGRQALARVLLRHVIEVARQAPAVRHTLVLSGDPDVQAEAENAGAVFLPEEPQARGLNAALGAALDHLQDEPPKPTIVLFADLPLLETADLQAAHSMLQVDPESVVVGPSTRGGTSLLGFWRRPLPELVFGEESYERFAELLEREEIRMQKLFRPGLYQDLDEPEDIEAVLAAPRCPERVRRVLRMAAGAGGE